LDCLAVGDVVEVFEDCGDGGDSAEDGEEWDHGWASFVENG